MSVKDLVLKSRVFEFNIKIEMEKDFIKIGRYTLDHSQASFTNAIFAGAFEMSQTLPRLKTSVLHYNRAIMVACPRCKSEIGKVCIRIDGRGSRCHRMRVEEYERDLRQARALYKETMETP